MKTVGVISLGCAKNLVDSEVILGVFSSKGFEIVNDCNSADLIIINTCGFINEAREESFKVIRENLKNKGRKKVAVTGCLSEMIKFEIKKLFPEIDYIAGVNDVERILNIIEGEEPFSKIPYIYSHNSPRILSTPKTWAYVKISEGCSHQCSFCSIPKIKGPMRSRKIDSILEEVEKLSEKGVREVNLVSQDSTSYGKDLNLKNGIVELLKRLNELRSIKWIRVLYAYPEEVTDDFIEMLGEENVVPYIDIPFQHSHPDILKRMRRSIDGRRALKFIEKIRNKVSDITIRTSLIVGFPGEGDIEFKDLLNFVEQARFDRLGVFTYSAEENLNASIYGDTVPQDLKEKRREILLLLQQEINLEKNAHLINKEIEVLVEGTSSENPDYLVGRAKSQAPEVDGVVIARKGKEKEDFLKVRIEKIGPYDFFGRVI
ncbi:MAG: 30S ribosomal protein S12 methylthiotransferase RimO [Candidatus Aminicenantia bacterium]